MNDFSIQTLKRSLTAFINLTYFYCLYELAKNVVRARPDFLLICGEASKYVEERFLQRKYTSSFDE